MQSKKQLLRAIRRETKPPKGFGQWILIIEHRRVSKDIGLLVLEAQLNGKPEWSGSMSVNLPEQKKFGPDGTKLQGDWETVGVGQSRFNVLTLELRGKSVIELAKEYIKRSFEEGKIQDLIPWGKS
jgi:hypothetical protein